jgi:hypothetical protein
VPPDLSALLDAMRRDLAVPIPPEAGLELNTEQGKQFTAWAQAFRPRPLKIELAGATTATGGK